MPRIIDGASSSILLYRYYAVLMAHFKDIYINVFQLFYGHPILKLKKINKNYFGETSKIKKLYSISYLANNGSYLLKLRHNLNIIINN